MEASFTYVLVDVPLIPEASLRLDRLDCSGTVKWAAKQNRFMSRHTRIKEWKNKARKQIKRHLFVFCK